MKIGKKNFRPKSLLTRDLFLSRKCEKENTLNLELITALKLVANEKKIVSSGQREI